MNYQALILNALIISSNSLAAMGKVYLPEHLEKKILKMVLFREPTPDWISWLIERNAERAKQTTYTHVTSNGLLPDCSKYHIVWHDLSYKPLFGDVIELSKEQETNIDCRSSFINFKFKNPCSLNKNNDGQIIVNQNHNIPATLQQSLEVNFKEVSDYAVSKDGKLFATVMGNTLSLWEIPSGIFRCKAILKGSPFIEIVSLDSLTRSVVLQNKSNQLYVYNWKTNTQHLFYDGSNYSKLYCLAMNHANRIIGKRAGIETTIHDTIITDIGSYFEKLTLAQIRLLKLIHRAHSKNQKKQKPTKEYKVNLTADNAGIIHARRAFHTLPAEIKQLVADMVKLPWLDFARYHCASALSWL